MDPSVYEHYKREIGMKEFGIIVIISSCVTLIVWGGLTWAFGVQI